MELTKETLDQLTLENFTELTGRQRFKMKNEQAKRGLSREAAFAEWKVEQANALRNHSKEAELCEAEEILQAAAASDTYVAHDEETGFQTGDFFTIEGDVNAKRYRFLYRHKTGVIRAEIPGGKFSEFTWLDHRAKLIKA